jgi:hypothetical protein
MLQIFDVSSNEAVLLHKEIIGSRGTTSDATDDHLAFTYFASRGLLALPMGICDGDASGGNYGTQMSFNGLMVYKVNAETGFELLGKVGHQDASSAPSTPYASNCYNWWQNPNSMVKRSIFMEDYVYSISDTQMKVNDVRALETTIGGFSLPGDVSKGSTYCTVY